MKTALNNCREIERAEVAYSSAYKVEDEVWAGCS